MRSRDGGLEVLCQPSIAPDPGEEPFDDPAPRVNSEADLIGVLAHDLDRNQRGFGDLLAGIPAVGEDPLDVEDMAAVITSTAVSLQATSQGVQGGGCSGLSYNVRFDTQPRERDRIFQFGDVRVFVDPKSFIYLHGMILDYQETLMQQGFVFVNPQATKSCGCGTSFSA